MLKRTHFIFSPNLDKIAYFKNLLPGKHKYQAPDTYSTEIHSGLTLEHFTKCCDI